MKKIRHWFETHHYNKTYNYRYDVVASTDPVGNIKIEFYQLQGPELVKETKMKIPPEALDVIINALVELKDEIANEGDN